MMVDATAAQGYAADLINPNPIVHSKRQRTQRASTMCHARAKPSQQT